MKVDLENAQGGLLAEGEHVFRIADVKDDVSKRGNEMMILDLVAIADPFKGAEVRDWIVPHFFPDKFVDLLQSVGVDLPTAGTDFDVSVLVNLRVRATIYHEPYEGKPKAKVSGYAPVQAADPDDPLEPAGSTSDEVPFLWVPGEWGRESNYNPFA